MKKAIYNKKTREFDYEHDISSKLTERGYGDWTTCMIYGKEEIQQLGKPDSRNIPQFYETPDGQMFQLHAYFSFMTENERRERIHEPWFGKVCIFKDGTFYDLEQDQVLFKEDTTEFESFEPCDKEHCIAFHHDWSAFDKIGAYDESYLALRRNGKTLLITRKTMAPSFESGKLVSISTDKDNYNVEQLDLKQTLKETAQKMVALGESEKNISEIVTSAIKESQKDGSGLS